jgi:hypothetical protein
MEKENVGNFALLDNAWHQILDIRENDGKIEYSLFSRDEWVPSVRLKEIKEKLNTTDGLILMEKSKYQLLVDGINRKENGMQNEILRAMNKGEINYIQFANLSRICFW